MKSLRKVLKDVRALMKDFRIFEVSGKTSPEFYQLRRLSASYPIYFALLEKTQFYQEFIYTCMPFSEDVELSFINKDTPILQIPRQRTLLAGLPFWVYLTEEFLEKYTELIGTLPQDNIEKFKEFAENTSLEKITGTTREYLEDLMRLLAPYNTASLFTALEDLETYWETPQKIKIPEEVLQEIIQEFFPDLERTSK